MTTNSGGGSPRFPPPPCFLAPSRTASKVVYFRNLNRLLIISNYHPFSENRQGIALAPHRRALCPNSGAGEAIPLHRLSHQLVEFGLFRQPNLCSDDNLAGSGFLEARFFGMHLVRYFRAKRMTTK